MESDYHWLVAVALVTSSIIAVTANAFLLFIFARRRSLRTIPNRFVINLLVTNLLSSILLIPLLVVDQGFLPAEFNHHRHLQTASPNDTIEGVVDGIFNPAPNQNVTILQTSEPFVGTSTTLDNIIALPDTDHLCYFAQASTSFVCTASIFSILLIGINQYFGVIHSLRYHFYVNKPRATVFILSSWLAALTCAALSTVTHSDGGLWHFCAKRTVSSGAKALNTAFAFSYFFVVILAPFLAICIIYLCIYTAAHQNSERMRKSTSACSTTPLDACQAEEMVVEVLEEEEEEVEEVEEEARTPTSDRRGGLPKVHSAPNFSSLESTRRCDSTIIVHQEVVKVKRTSSDRNNFIVNLKHKISNASVFRYREETRAAKISVLVIFMVLICYVPYGLTLVLSSSCIGISTGKVFNYLSLVLLVFSNVISPFLFGYRNKRVKREIGRLLGLVPTASTSVGGDLPRRPLGGSTITKNRSYEAGINITATANAEPLLVVPEVIVTCKVENEKKSILKRVGSGWNSYKKCNFITVPDSCLGDARGSFSSASTQVSNDEF